jgi:hypothetical protein
VLSGYLSWQRGRGESWNRDEKLNRIRGALKCGGAATKFVKKDKRRAGLKHVSCPPPSPPS